MKRIISILMIVSIMILSIGTVFAFDETVTTGLNIAAVEDENGLITVTATANHSTKIGGFTVYFVLDGVKAVNASDKTTELTSTTYKDGCVLNSDLTAISWDVSGGKYSSGSYYQVVVGGTTPYAFSGNEVFKAYFVKSDATATLSTTAITLGTSTAKTSKINLEGGTTLYTKNTSEQAYFGLKVTPYVAQGGGNTGWTETDGTTTVTVKFPTTSTEKAGAESSWTGNASTQASKKAVKFGKNETGAKMLGATVENGKLVVNNADYFVEYDGEKYYGLIDVEAGKSWAILIIESVSAN